MKQNEKKKANSFLKKYAANLRKKGLPVIFNLRHLAKTADVRWVTLNRIVSRRNEKRDYELFSIPKRSGGWRYIHKVAKNLAKVQKYINQEILRQNSPHSSSYAFHKMGGIRSCAEVHCGARWLIQLDLKDFFYSISELKTFQIFKKMGYSAQVSFELSRLCTTCYLPSEKSEYLKALQPRKQSRRKKHSALNELKYKGTKFLGVLPQGASTSPMLSNLAAFNLDETLKQYALENGFKYSRYADDLAFSTTELPQKKSIACLLREIIAIIRKNGFKENPKKTRISGPGSRKKVLGLLVDGSVPRVPKKLWMEMDKLLYSVEKYGIKKTAGYGKFVSPLFFGQHILGMIAFMKDVSPVQFSDKLGKKFEKTISEIEEYVAKTMEHENKTTR